MNGDHPRVFRLGMVIGTLLLGLMAVIGVAFIMPSQTAAATTLTVNTTDDTDDGVCDAAHCSLREAIHAANNAAGADTIDFALPLSSTIILSSTQLPIISDTLTIDGSTVVSLTLNGNNLQVIEVGNSKVLTLTGLTINNGRNGLYNDGGILVVNNCRIIKNRGGYNGGGIRNYYGTLTINNSTISDNGVGGDSGNHYGGGIYNLNGTVTIKNSTINENSVGVEDPFGNYGSGYVYGGGIYNIGTLIVIDSTFSMNRVHAICGTKCGLDMEAYGGGIFSSGTLIINNSNFYRNFASAWNDNYSESAGGGIIAGGVISISESVFSSNGAYVHSYSGSEYVSSSGGGIMSGGVMSISESIFTNNWASVNHWSGADVNGGGISNGGELYISGSIFISNTSRNRGGGIFNSNTLIINSSDFYENLAEGGGGGIFNDSWLSISYSEFISNTAGISGGGIHNRDTLTVTYSTFSNNTAVSRGGGIRNFGSLSVGNSTFSGNAAENSGGGIRNSGILTATNSTFSDNAAVNIGGGIDNNGTMAFFNNILANSLSGGDCYNEGVLGSNVHNLVEDGSCNATFSGNPFLGPLQDNGGPTMTHALLAPSPAIDHGDNATCALIDQRGVLRPLDGDGNGSAICDIGAFEYDGPPPFKTYLPQISQN